ncbi:MAG: hypothetical protein MJ152_02655 [Clostridia bacterium]|nr:hypothetical protein [Clostridia bacterium]
MLSKLKPTITLIDSGVGGISVLKNLINRYGSGNYIFYADNLNMPYGNKTKEFVASRIEKIINYLNKNYMPDIIIIACNTASTSIDQQENSVIKMELNSSLPILATPLTKRNMQTTNIIGDRTLAEMIEKHILNKNKIKSIVKQHVKKLNLCKLKTLVLGCTHYELVSGYFKEFCKNTNIINNSDNLIKMLNFNPDNTQTNILLLQSKKDQNFNNKMWQILLN